jgi:hypothetical protein
MRNRALFVLVAVVLAGCGGGEDEAKVQPQVLAMASPAEMAQAPVTPQTIEVGGVKYPAVPEVAAPTMEMAGREMLQGIFQNDMYRFRTENVLTSRMVPSAYQQVGEISPDWQMYAVKVTAGTSVVPALLLPLASTYQGKGDVEVMIMTCESDSMVMQVSATSSHFADYRHEPAAPLTEVVKEPTPEFLGKLQEGCRLAAQL